MTRIFPQNSKRMCGIRKTLARGIIWPLAVTLSYTAPTMAQSPAQGIVQNQTLIPRQETNPALRSANFLPPELLMSAHHRVRPFVKNNGIANTYSIETPHGEHWVQGTEQAKIRIFEIQATEKLRNKSTIGAIGKSTKNRTVNLVKTPVRVVKGVGDRIDAVENAQDALFFVPENTGYLLGKLAKGVGQLGVTGARIIKGAGNTSCSGLNCVADLGEDAWSGLNSIVGKHNAARRLHKQLGTNPETRNKDLQREINRLSYAEAYSGTAYKIGLGTGYANIDYFSPLVTGVGYVNNGEFLGSYEDAHKRRNRNKERLEQWGVNKDNIKTFYSNEAYTKAMRAEINELLASFGTPETRTRLVAIAKDAGSPYIAYQNLVTLRYLSREVTKGNIREIAPESSGAVGVRRNGTIVLPYAADYLQLTPQSEQSLQYMAKLKNLSPHYTASEIHIIGKASPEFKAKAISIGVIVTEGI